MAKTTKKPAPDPIACPYCGGVFAVILGTLADGRRVAAHPHCLAAALKRHPEDAAAREIAAVFHMPEGQGAQGGGHIGWRDD